ncbi:hypothetical protein M405DRAFT_724053 [Rhizopogon salebrosus TDB-379]|nr:hypothetical protein M405DRAFT_724053 [Rhizopogon salebrosus TDB-379]
MCLVAWVAIRRELVEDLKTYMDDSFSFELAGNLLYYEPYREFFPAKQTHLLQLWDYIGLPHERAKQLFGSPLTVIGFDVDPNAMQVSLPPVKKEALVMELRRFGVAHRRWTLREFQWLAGWCEWAFNVFPLLKPGLSAVYVKMAGKAKPHVQMYVNTAVKRELTWMADHMERSDGLLLYKSLDFCPTDDDVVVAYTDASSSGLGIWFPDDQFACQCPLLGDAPVDTIFFFEALAVCSAIHALANMYQVPSRLLVYTDNTNTVAMFNTLRAKPAYNNILLSAMDVLLEHHVNLCVQHIAGEENIIADALSRYQNERAQKFAGDIDISPFEPPRDALGELKK